MTARIEISLVGATCVPPCESATPVPLRQTSPAASALGSWFGSSNCLPCRTLQNTGDLLSVTFQYILNYPSSAISSRTMEVDA